MDSPSEYTAKRDRTRREQVVCDVSREWRASDCVRRAGGGDLSGGWDRRCIGGVQKNRHKPQALVADLLGNSGKDVGWVLAIKETRQNRLEPRASFARTCRLGEKDTNIVRYLGACS